ncbi:hypothetical protein [Pseudomonas sp. O230]|uniref:hypothetical protein n=1 Tax=Pseudomonas sp. O230 TaxID=3159450 RepID=UPI00387AE01B
MPHEMFDRKRAKMRARPSKIVVQPIRRTIPNAGRTSGKQNNKVESTLGISNTEIQSVEAAFESDSDAAIGAG